MDYKKHFILIAYLLCVSSLKAQQWVLDEIAEENNGLETWPTWMIVLVAAIGYFIYIRSKNSENSKPANNNLHEVEEFPFPLDNEQDDDGIDYDLLAEDLAEDVDLPIFPSINRSLDNTASETKAKPKEEKPIILKSDITISPDFEAIDLGLSVKWANYNFGADSENICGKYYIWGEVEIPEEYAKSIRLEKTKTGGFIQKDNYYYRLDGKSPDELKEILGGTTSISGNTDYDVAAKVLGKGWRIPTKEEALELHTYCKWELKEYKGIKGCLVTGPNNNSIFLPLAGHILGYNNSVSCLNVQGRYWLGNPYLKNPGFAEVLLCDIYKPPYYNDFITQRRCFPFNIRPVFDK